MFMKMCVESNETLIILGLVTKGETVTRVNGNVSFSAGKRLQSF